MKKRKLRIRFAVSRPMDEVDYAFKMNLRRAILAALDEEEFPYDAEVSVTLCDNEFIHGLNRDYRNVDRPTDVLSFPMFEPDEFEAAAAEDGTVTLGDIVISLERAKTQAEEIGNSFLREVAFLAIHSTLHLLGYDHERGEEDDRIQCEKQKKIIEGLSFEE